MLYSAPNHPGKMFKWLPFMLNMIDDTHVTYLKDIRYIQNDIPRRIHRLGYIHLPGNLLGGVFWRAS